MLNAEHQGVVILLKSASARLAIDDISLTQLFWQYHPRHRFIKTLPYRANVIDIGAASGGLSLWKNWLEPKRLDLQLYGVDILPPGKYAHNYAGWEQVDLDQRYPEFPSVGLDVAYSAHLIEHLKDPAQFVRWLGQRLELTAKVYLEWPNPTTTKLPKKEDMLTAAGLDVIMSNFYDDSTHKEPLSPTAISDMLIAEGFLIVESGVVNLGIIGEELYARAQPGEEGQVDRTMGYWSMTDWSCYIIAKRKENS